MGIPFGERWSRFDTAAVVLRGLLHGGDPRELGLPAGLRITPLPARPPQIWIGSWGSTTRLRALAATADGWLVSGYNTDPHRYAECRGLLDSELRRVGREPSTLPDMIATVWLHVSSTAHEASSVLDGVLAPTLRRDPRVLAQRLPIGTPAHCAQVLTGYVRAGARRVLLWPVGDGVQQLRRFMEEVAPRIPAAAGSA